MNEDSVFTKIINGEIPGEIIYQDESSAVILTLEPMTPGHMLVIPRQQADSLWDIDETTYHHLWDVAKQMVMRLQKAYDYQRIGTVVEGFGVPHAHIHIFGYTQPLEPTIIEHVKHKKIASSQELRTIADILRTT